MNPTIDTGTTATLAEQRQSENFPVSLRVMPALLRQELRALYNVVRVIDDLGDEAAGDRLAGLDAFRAQVEGLYGGQPPASPVLRELLPSIARHQLDRQHLLDLIEANRLDQTVSGYARFEDLLGYCRLSAVPVGRLVLQLFDRDSPDLTDLSDDVCVALQILEHCQDVAEDYHKGRIYLPQQELRDFGVSPSELGGRHTGPRLRSLIQLEVERADRLLDSGDLLVSRLDGWARLAIAGYLAGGRATAAAIRRCDGDVLGSSPKPRHRAIALQALRILFRAARR